MTKKELEAIWDAPELDAADQLLIEAYLKAGTSLDSLPYTVEFEKLVKQVAGKHDRDSCREIHRRLLTLRKRGQLPRVGPFGF